ncbi:MAG: shikimate dehydrogenase [Candidatus Gastranaerophilales bacterium]|nr:shikimate dehydrogenase [Candidatus Gastranaerophilales bacterium]
MIKLGLIGYPLGHSMSAIIQKAAFESCGLDGEYEILETEPELLVDRVKFLKSRGYAGFNVTIPLKVPITLFLDEVDSISNQAGCANTVKVMPNLSLYGYNTDVYGFSAAIPTNVKNELKGSKVAILGNGGASRAVAVALGNIGVKQLDFYVRNIINASTMVNIVRENFPNIKIELKQIQHIYDLSDYKMLVNTTPLGMRGKAMGLSPVDEKAMKTLKPDAVIYDIVYNPIKTEFINIAQKLGLQTIGGLDMLVYQAAKAFEIWTGKYPDTQNMKIAALESLAV